MERHKRIPCDQCHLRKVKCDYQLPCQRCREAASACTTNIVRKKRGPKKRSRITGTAATSASTDETLNADQSASRAVDEHDQFYRSSPINIDSSLQPSVEGGPSALQYPPFDPDLHIDLQEDTISFERFAQNILSGSSVLQNHQTAPHTLPAHPPAGNALPTWRSGTTPATLPSQSTESIAVISRCVDLFFAHLNPTYPLVSREHMDQCLHHLDGTSHADREMIWAICALALSHVDDWPDLTTEQRAIMARQYIRNIRHSRVEWEDLETPHFSNVLASLFMAIALFEPRFKSTSWFYVRESIALAQMLGLDKDETYHGLDEATCIRYRRAYSLLFITERGSAILHNTPVTVLVPPSLPKVSLPGEDPSICIGLNALHALFSLLDMKFVTLWNNTGHCGLDSSSNNSSSDIAILQQHLQELRHDPGLSEIQKANVLITQHWLRLIFWHAALRQGLVTTAAVQPFFTYSYPIDIAMSLCDVVKSLPPAAIQVHGLGIFEKQFDIAYSLMDALSMSAEPYVREHECLRYLLLSLSLSPTSRQIYVRTLEKAMTGRQKNRSLREVQLLLDEPASQAGSRRHSLIFPR